MTMARDPYIDLCLVENNAAVGSLDADPYSVLYRDIVPPSLLKEGAGVVFRAEDGTGPTAVMVKGLPWWANDIGVEQALGSIGISDIGMIRFQEHPVSGRSKGACLVRFHSADAAKECADRWTVFRDEYGEHSLHVVIVSDEDITQFESTAHPAKGGDRGFGLDRGPPAAAPAAAAAAAPAATTTIPPLPAEPAPTSTASPDQQQGAQVVSRALLEKLRQTLSNPAAAGGAPPNTAALQDMLRARQAGAAAPAPAPLPAQGAGGAAGFVQQLAQIQQSLNPGGR